MPAIPFTDSPFRLLGGDLELLVRHRFIASQTIGLPCQSTETTDEISLSKWSNIFSLSLQLVLFLSTLPLIGLLCMPVFSVITAVGLVGIYFAVNAWIVEMQQARYQSQEGNDFQDEIWLYVNGICCDQSWLGMNCEMLARIFGRRIIGVYNPTLGPVLDLVDCIYQRCFTQGMEDFRQLYKTTIRELLRPEISKVVLIAHSQGGIIASQVIDRLLVAEDEQTVRKLEVYTFGSAANHFSGNGRIRHIEHFANEGDFVAQTGVVAYKTLNGNRYDGTLYINNATGHLLNTHYLRSTFTDGNEAASSRLAGYIGGR
ncbi:hypothetical protein EDD21DRAFT_321156 [Dissophora ornata]|nr:hypothetical protein EDD21DRAFT_321156 [Dissophora ornata]